MIRRLVLLGLVLALAACAQAPKSTPVAYAPAPPRGEPTDYLNLPQANVRAMLGAPQFVRQDGATQMWRYDGAQCRAFFFFYGAKGSEAVRHVETLPAGTTSAADPICLSALKNAKKAS